MEVIVINDGSTDGTAHALAALQHPWLQVINLERNSGKSQGAECRARTRTLSTDAHRRW